LAADLINTVSAMNNDVKAATAFIADWCGALAKVDIVGMTAVIDTIGAAARSRRTKAPPIAGKP
jgi:hypothetical protein